MGGWASASIAPRAPSPQPSRNRRARRRFGLLRRLLDALERPIGRFRDCGNLRSGQFTEQRFDSRPMLRLRPSCGVTQCDAGVPYQSCPFRPFRGAVPKSISKLFLIHFRQAFQSRPHQAVFIPLLTRLEFLQRTNRCFAVIGTDILTDITSVDLPANGLSEFLWDASA